jgi:hypothetical protein
MEEMKKNGPCEGTAHGTIKGAEICKVIRVEYSIGKGTLESPIQKVESFYLLDGTQIGTIKYYGCINFKDSSDTFSDTIR